MNVRPLTLTQLKPFPLPKELRNLPHDVLQLFVSLYDLTKGYVLSLQTYKDHENEVVRAIDHNIQTLNRIITLLKEYNLHADTILALAKDLERLYREFLVLETQQYQLLSTNYNASVLKKKFERLTDECDARTVVMARSYLRSDDVLANDLLLFLHNFKDSRKEYHMRKEKLNRWDEERISGLL